jgi:hypothetical protein
MDSEEVEILRSTYDEYSETLAQLHSIQQHLNDKAIEIAKINLLIGGIAASVVAIRPSNIAISYFTSGVITLMASIWYSASVYSQTKTYDIGISSESFEEVLSADSASEHYKELTREYSGMIEDFNSPYSEEKDDFENALWLAVATIFLFIMGAGSTVVKTIYGIQYSAFIDLPIIMCIGILLMYGKHRDELE